MNQEMDDLKSRWQAAKLKVPVTGLAVDDVIQRAREKRRSSLYFHYGNVAVLTLTLIMVVVFFYFIFPFQEMLSKVGVAFMAGGLLLRILIEIFSSIKSLGIKFTDEALKATEDTLAFYRFRKRIHGPVTISIVAFYAIGFYLLTPEFSKYFPTWVLVLIDASFIPIGLVLIWQIRKGIQAEMEALAEIVELKSQLTRNG